MKKLSVIHPFLFAIFPILFLFANNMDEVPTIDLLSPILFVIGGTLILFFLLRFITKNYYKSGIITSCFAVLFFSYGHIRGLFPSSLEIAGAEIYFYWGFFLAPLWVLLGIISVFWIRKSSRNFSTSTKFLNIVAIILVIISLVNIGVSEIKIAGLSHENLNEEGGSLNLSSQGNLPDIYYIILDEYARSSTFKELLNYDNSEFIDYLTNKGFYIASRSRSNYPLTALSLASSLNMEYLKMRYVKKVVELEFKSKVELYQMIKNNKVSQFLKSKGYRYIFISNGYYEDGMSKYADVYKIPYRILGGHFTNALIRTTMLAPFIGYFISTDGSHHRTQVLYAFDVLADLPDIKEPMFVFAHVLAPHTPYVFDRNGNPAPLVKGQDTRDKKEQYLDQAIFVTKKIKTVVDEILSKSDVAPIIILQADTGSSLGRPAVLDKAMIEMDEQIRMNIFNAYFLPDNDNQLLYESITPVNTFRIVFNLYFETNYDLLKDESYYFKWW